MLVHLGAGVAVQSRDVLTLTDLQRPLPPDTKALFDGMSRRNRVRRLGGEPKTMVLVQQDRQTVCYLSSVGLRTLRMRMEEEEALLRKLAGRP